MQIFFSFSLLVDMGGFIGGGAIAPSCMMKGYFLNIIPFLERFQRESMGRVHASSESSPIPGVPRIQ